MPRVQPTLTARAILPLVSGLRDLGHDPLPLLAAVGVDAAVLDDPDARVPVSAGSGLLLKAAAATGDDCIGLHLAQHADLKTVDVHFFGMAASRTLEDAYRRLSRYQRLIHETSRIDIAASTDLLTLRHVLPGGLPAARHTAEFLLAAWVRVGRVITASSWNPDQVRFAHAAPPRTDEHDSFFGVPVRFNAGENALQIGNPARLLRCAGADAALASFFDRYAAERIPSPADEAPTFSDRVRSHLSAELRDGEPHATTVATSMKMSVRTLSRALAAEGTTFREVLDQLRRERAVRYLSNPRMSVGEAAFLLGFSELSAFHRAFKRWTGQTPSEFRTQSLSRSAN